MNGLVNYVVIKSQRLHFHNGDSLLNWLYYYGNISPFQKVVTERSSGDFAVAFLQWQSE